MRNRQKFTFKTAFNPKLSIVVRRRRLRAAGRQTRGMTTKIGVIKGMAHPMQMGKRTRMCFARIEEALAVPDLIEVQKKSYEYFLKEGLR